MSEDKEVAAIKPIILSQEVIDGIRSRVGVDSQEGMQLFIADAINAFLALGERAVSGYTLALSEKPNAEVPEGYRRVRILRDNA